MARGKSPIETTGQLTEIIRASIPMKYQKMSGHPAKRTFQAIRIECKRELEVLRNSLDDMIEILNPGGRICIITFHSLEDRIVKGILKKMRIHARVRVLSRYVCVEKFPKEKSLRKNRFFQVKKRWK